jgi:hypothetical protein
MVCRTHEGKLNLEFAMMRMRNRGAIPREYARAPAFSLSCDWRVKRPTALPVGAAGKINRYKFRQ